jgi:hypothetical protein
MAVIVVDTIGQVSPPKRSVPTADEVPLDFRYFAVNEYGEEGASDDEAIVKALAAYAKSLETVRTESVVPGGPMIGSRLLTNPCLYADAEAINERELLPSDWRALVDQRRTRIAETLRSVGRIQLYQFASEARPTYGYEVGIVIGTGFVVAPGIVMTNRHVAQIFAQIDAPNAPFRNDDRKNSAVVLIDFGGDSDEQQNVHRVERVLFSTTDPGDDSVETEPDVALLKLRPDPTRESPPPLPLQTSAPNAPNFSRRAFVCGYPTYDRTHDPLLAKYFQRLRVKRVSLGQMTGVSPVSLTSHLDRLVHDCTTLMGSSGSPVVDFETGTVWGLHCRGFEQVLNLKGNSAEPLWRVCELRPVRDLLGSAATTLPSPLPPLQQREHGVAERQGTRPVLFIERDDIAPTEPFPTDWVQPDSAEHQHVRDALPGVGLVQSEDRPDQPAIASTGFLVAPDVLLTFLGQWKLASGQPNLVVDFARSIGNEPAPPCRVAEVLYIDERVALLRLDPTTSQSLPTPLPLQGSRSPDPDLASTTVFVVGHPTARARQTSPEINARVFPPPYGVKRLAFGRLRAEEFPEGQILTADLRHDCSTTVGDAGAPVVSLASGRVLGMHVGGQFGKSNFAISTWSILSNPEVRTFVPHIEGL